MLRLKRNMFYCLYGNSCRSVMAEYLLREALQGRKDVDVSAGTSAFCGGQHAKRSKHSKEGIDASHHRSRPLTKMLKSGLDLAMTSMHRYQIISFEPSVANRTYLLREFAKVSSGAYDLGVPDPIGQSAQTYEGCALVIKESIQRIVELI